MRQNVGAAAVGLVLSIGAASGQTLPVKVAATEPVRTGAAAYGDWQTDAPGVRRKITPADLPQPLASPPAANPSQGGARPAGALPQVPPGFAVSAVATGLGGPRVIRVAPNGDVFVAETKSGTVSVFRFAPGSGQATKTVFASGLHQPYGIAFYPVGADPRWVYVASPDKVVRFPYRLGETTVNAASQTIVDEIPTGGHSTRDLAFSPDGKTLFVSVGSGSNVAEEVEPLKGAELTSFVRTNALGALWGEESHRADVLAFDPEGHQGRAFATGIRNCSGLTVRPVDGALWCAVNERDLLGDDLPPDYATHVEQGRFYGWPWYYIGDHADPRLVGERPDLAGKVTVPDVLIQPHSAPLGIAFYEGTQFPTAYKGSAFVTLHGSWNRAKRTGYKVVRLLFTDAKPTGAYEDFMTGFVTDEAGVWGRPVGVAVAKDGALLVTDDESNTLWRVTYTGARASR